MRLWRAFYETLKRRNYDATNKKFYREVASNVDLHLSVYDGYIIPSEVKLFNLNKWLDKMVDVIAENHSEMDTIEGAFRVARQVNDVIDDMWKEYLQLKYNPTPIQKLCSNILDQVAYQDDPKNRIITNVKFEPVQKSEDSLDTIPVFKVFITSDCDGWAEDTDIFIGYSLKNEPNNFIGKSEAEVTDRLNSMETFAEFLNHLDDFCDTVEKVDPESDDYGMVFFKSSSYRDICEGLACQHLISSGGGCNWENIRRLRKLGFDIYPGDHDSFGWLTGCIENKNGHVLVYG